MLGQIIASLLLLAIVQLLVRARFIRSQRLSITNKNMVCLPDFIFFVGVICAVLFAILTAITAFTNGSPFHTIALSIFSILGISIIIGWKNCRIVYEENTFTQKTFFGRKRTFTYDQLTAYKGNKGFSNLHIFAGNKKVFVDRLALNRINFLLFVKKKYRTIHGGKALPVINKSDLFLGHVHSPGDYISVYVFVLLFILGSWILLAANTPTSFDTSNTEYLKITFSHCEAQGNKLICRSPDYVEDFILSNYGEDMPEIDTFLSLCDGKTPFDLWGYRYKSQSRTPTREPPYYSIKQLTYHGGIFYSFDQANAYHRESLISATLFFTGILLLWNAWFALTVLVGRHPERFRPWFVKLFFKDRCIQ